MEITTEGARTRLAVAALLGGDRRSLIGDVQRYVPVVQWLKGLEFGTDHKSDTWMHIVRRQSG